MSFPTHIPTLKTESDPVTQIYSVLVGLNLQDKFLLALTMMAGCLWAQDEFTRHRLIVALPDELRAAIQRLEEIKEETPRLQ